MKTLNGFEEVFNTNHKIFGHIDLAVDVAKDFGYKYFEWNGRVYSTNGSEVANSQELGLDKSNDINALILNSNLDAKMRDLSTFLQDFKKTGYPYFKFNGFIYNQDGEECEIIKESTSINVKDNKKHYDELIKNETQNFINKMGLGFSPAEAFAIILERVLKEEDLKKKRKFK